MTNEQKFPNKRYMGDGVYASFDGWNIWLETEREAGVERVALEPPTLMAVNEYWEYVKAFYKEDDHE